MISAILIDHEIKPIEQLQNCMNKCCPKIKICGFATTMLEANQLILEQTPDIAFIEVAMPENKGFQIFDYQFDTSFETIFTSKIAKDAVDAFQFGATSFILKPIQEKDLIIAVGKAKNKIWEKKKQKEMLAQLSPSAPPGNLIGIPTIEGFEFISINEIIRCEGLQNCTRIITKNRTDLISSYTIGKFISLLAQYHFFSPHKSHLVNLSQIKKYYKEGTIQLSDNSHVPVSKRRKSQFLNLMLLFR